MEALSGYASPGAPLPDSDDDWEPGLAAGEAAADAVAEPAVPGDRVSGGGPEAAPPAAAQQRQAAVPAKGRQAAAAPGRSAGRNAAGSTAPQQPASTAAQPRQQNQAAAAKLPASRKRKAASQVQAADCGGAVAPEVKIITADVPAAAASAQAAANGTAIDVTKGKQGSKAAAIGADHEGSSKAAHRQQKKQKQQHQQQRWSSLTADDHAWFLARQGRALEGQEAQVFEALSEHVAVERAAVLATQRDAAAAFSDKYRFVARRSLQQMEVDNLQRRARVRNYPRLYRLQGVIPLPAAGQDAVAAQGQDGGGDDGADAPDMWHLQQLARTAPDLELALPRCPFRVPLDVPYLPSEVEIGPQAQPRQPATAAAAGTDHTPADAGNAPKVKATIASVRKLPAPEVSQDPALAGFVAAAADGGDAAETIDVAMAAGTFEALVATLPHDLSLGWEIPVRIGPPEPATEAEAGKQRTGSGSGTASSRCIFLDKPLLRRALTLRERHERLYKHALLSIALRSARNAESAAFGAPLRVGRGTSPASAGTPAAAAVASPADSAGGQLDAMVEQPAQRVVAVAAAQVVAAAAADTRERAEDAAQPRQPAMSGLPLRMTRAVARAADTAAAADDSGACADNSAQPAAAPGAYTHPSEPGEGANPAGDVQRQAPSAQSLISTTRRGCAYDLWQLGRYRVVMRSHEAAVLRDPARTALLARAKMEYMPKYSLEAVTAQEAARRWAALQLRPEAALLIGRFAVETSELLRVEFLRLADVLAQGEETGFRPAHAYRLITCLLQQLSTAPPGRYLLTHMPDGDSITCFQALPSDMDSLQVRTQLLPCTNAQKGVIYDVHAAHANSGATDEGAFPFVPPQWRPFNEHVPQIPGTFPVRVRGAPKPGAPRADEAAKEKRRMRKLLPSAWAHLGIGNDWDTTAAGGGGIGGGGGDVAAYARALEEGAEEL